MGNTDLVQLQFRGEVWHWRGPSPYHFVSLSEEASGPIRDIASVVTYGWGMIPVEATVGETTWTTALFPKDGGYVLPIKDAVRLGEGIVTGDVVSVRMVIRERSGGR